MKAVIVAAAAFVVSVSVSPAPGQQEEYARAYRLIREARRAEYIKDMGLAWSRYTAARRLLENVCTMYPDWNRKAVNARLALCTEGARKTAPLMVRNAGRLFAEMKRLSETMARLHGERVALVKQLDWEEMKLDQVADLASKFRRQAEERRARIREEGAAAGEQAEEEAALSKRRKGGASEALSPEKMDSDNDGLSDAREAQLGTDPNKADTDSDGLSDSQELEYGTNPLNEDTDNDDLTDGEEVNEWNTDPLDPDTDGDGTLDGTEVDNGWDPLDPYQGS